MYGFFCREIGLKFHQHFNTSLLYNPFHFTVVGTLF